MRTIVIGSVTYAQKAKRLLLRSNIRARIVKNTSAEKEEGCAYGVEVPESLYLDALSCLRQAGIPVRKVL